MVISPIKVQCLVTPLIIYGNLIILKLLEPSTICKHTLYGKVLYKFGIKILIRIKTHRDHFVRKNYAKMSSLFNEARVSQTANFCVTRIYLITAEILKHISRKRNDRKNALLPTSLRVGLLYHLTACLTFLSHIKKQGLFQSLTISLTDYVLPHY